MVKKILYRFIIIYLLLVIYHPLVLRCEQESKFSINLKPYDYIVEQLLKNKIVMLGDFQHSSMLPHQSLITILNTIIETLKTKELKHEQVTLILERSPEEIVLINQYVDEGNIEPWLNHYSLTHSLEDIYLLENLRKIKGEFIKKNCDLKFKGFENNYTDEILFSRTEIEKEKWFVKERDSLVFEKTKKYLEENPNEKILVYYGSAHLIDGLINKKSFAPLLNEEECTGYFLAYFLKQHFGRQNVVTFNHVTVQSDILANTNLKDYKDVIFLINGSDSTICKFNSYNKYYDFIVVRHEYLRVPTPLRFIFSKKILKECYDGWADYEKWNQKYKNNLRNSYAMEAIEYISGRFFQYLGDYEKWTDTNKTTLFDRISTSSFSKYLFTIASYDPQKNNYYRNMLVSIGFGPGLYNPNYFPTSEEWNSTLWPTVMIHVKYLNSVGMMWIGDDNEKKIAQKYIYEITKLEFENPSQCLEWWYTRFCNYTF